MTLDIIMEEVPRREPGLELKFCARKGHYDGNAVIFARREKGYRVHCEYADRGTCFFNRGKESPGCIYKRK